MGSYCATERIIMKPDNSVIEDEFNEYPFSIPEVILDGSWEQYGPPKDIFSCGDDSIIVIRDNETIIYTKKIFAELLVKDKDGNTSWIDSRTVPFDGSFSYADIVELREANEFTIVKYDYDKFEKKKYKVMLEETTPLNNPKLEIDSGKLSLDVIESDKPRTFGGFSF